MGCRFALAMLGRGSDPITGSVVKGNLRSCGPAFRQSWSGPGGAVRGGGDWSRGPVPGALIQLYYCFL